LVQKNVRTPSTIILEQSFMETLYACKEDYENYGEGSDIAMDFNEKYDAARLSQAPQGEVDQMMEEYQVALDKPMFREK
jgi:hypothetical protein